MAPLSWLGGQLDLTRSELAVLGAVILTTFFVGFGGGVVFPIIPNLGVLIGISPLLVGIILSTNRFVRLVANAPAGALVDRIGTRTPFLIGMFVQAAACFGYAIAVIAPFPEAWFIGARAIWGLGSALVFATAYTIAADVSSETSRGTSMGLVRGGILFGAPAGLVLGGVVSELFSEVVAFLLAGGLALVATGLAIVTVPETHVTDQVRSSVSPWEIDTSPAALTVGTVNFAVYFVYFGALFASLVLLLAERELGIFGYGAQASSGLFMAITVLTAGVGMFVGGFISDRRGARLPVLLPSLVATSIGFGLLAISISVWWLAVACFLIGAGQGATSGPLMALLADLTPDHRMGRAVGTNNVLGDVGGGLGPVLILPVIDVVGFAPVYWFCAVLPIAAVVLLLVRITETSPRVAATE